MRQTKHHIINCASLMKHINQYEASKPEKLDGQYPIQVFNIDVL